MAYSGKLLKIAGPYGSLFVKRSLSTAAGVVQEYNYKPFDGITDKVHTGPTNAPQTIQAGVETSWTQQIDVPNVSLYPMMVMDSKNENANFLQFNLTGITDDNFVMEKVKYDVKSLKPEVVYMQNIRRDNFTTGMKTLMKQLGYSGYYMGSHDHQGTASFFKKDLYVHT